MLMIMPVVTQVPNRNATLGKEKGWEREDSNMDVEICKNGCQQGNMSGNTGLGEKAIQLFADASPVECHNMIL